MRSAAVVSAVLATAGLGVSMAIADSTEIGFSNITHNGNSDLSGGPRYGNGDVTGQLRCVVSSVNGNANQVDFTFRNLAGISSSIKEVYFDDGTAQSRSLQTGPLLVQSGSTFAWGAANPGNLPGGNNLAVPFNATPGFLGDSGQGGPSTGLDSAMEFLTIRFDLSNNQTYADVIARLFKDPALGGSLRIGLHVTSIGTQGGSDSYINTPMVPLPPASYAGLGMLGVLAGAAHLRRRRLAAR